MKRAFAVIRAVLWAATLLMCGAAAADSPDQVRHELAGSLVHHTVYLRHAYSGTYLHYDRLGRLINHVPHGHWTESGAVYPLKLEVNGAGLVHIEADRVAVAFDQRKGQWTTLRRENAPVVIDIQLEPSGMHVDEAKRTAAAIFAFNVDEIAKDLPAYWRPCAAGELKRDPARNRMFCFDKGVTPNMESHAPIATNATYDSRGTNDPKPVETITPRVTDVAREFHFNGSSILWLIVDEQGLPEDIYVVSPVGYGLDDEAVTAVARWRFAPPKVMGKGMRTQMTIEVTFKVPMPKRPIGRRW